MFGYITVNKPELKYREYDEYHGFYCGLCHKLGEYGLSKRLFVSFDMTFLYLLLTSLYESKTDKTVRKCPLHPFRGEMSYDNELAGYVADMTIILSYHKALDDLQDEKKLRGSAVKAALKSAYGKVFQKYKEKCLNIEDILKKLKELEDKGEKNIDVLSKLSGDMLGEIFAYKEDEWTSILSSVGHWLGRFVYLMDAFDDLEDDLKEGSFNPFVSMKDRESFESDVLEMLELMMAECTADFETLPLFDYREILRNILYAGVFDKYREIVERRAHDRSI